MSHYQEFYGSPLNKLTELFFGPDPDQLGEYTTFYQDVALLIAESGEKGVRFLLNQTQTTDELKLEAIIFAIGSVKSPLLDAAAFLRLYLQHKSDRLIAQAIDGLKWHGVRNAIDDVLPLLSHASPYIVGAVLRLLSVNFPERAYPILLESLKSPHPIVRINAIDELENLYAIQAIPSIEPLLNDTDPDVRNAAEYTLGFLKKEQAESGRD